MGTRRKKQEHDEGFHWQALSSAVSFSMANVACESLVMDMARSIFAEFAKHLCEPEGKQILGPPLSLLASQLSDRELALRP